MLSELKRDDIIDLELFSAGIARATSGQVTIAKIVQLNDIDVASSNLSSADIAHLMQTTKVEKILLSPDTEKKSQSEILDVYRKTVMRFLRVPDGDLGIVVKIVGPEGGCDEKGLQVIEVGRNVHNFEVGDIIVSCNDIPLRDLTANAAISILKSATSRRLTIVKGGFIVAESSSGVESVPEKSSSSPVKIEPSHSLQRDNVEASENSSDNKDWKEIRKDYLFYKASKRLRLPSTEVDIKKKDLEDVQLSAPVCTSYSTELSQSFYRGDARIFSTAVEKVKRDMNLI